MPFALSRWVKRTGSLWVLNSLAKRVAVIQSLLGTAMLNGIEPYTWLKDTLEKLSTWPHQRIDELLPIKDLRGDGSKWQKPNAYN